MCMIMCVRMHVAHPVLKKSKRVVAKTSFNYAARNLECYIYITDMYIAIYLHNINEIAIGILHKFYCQIASKNLPT